MTDLQEPAQYLETIEYIAVARIFDLLHWLRSKKTGRARRPCRAELVDLYAQNVPAQRPAPTNSKGGSS